MIPGIRVHVSKTQHGAGWHEAMPSPKHRLDWVHYISTRTSRTHNTREVRAAMSASESHTFLVKCMLEQTIIDQGSSTRHMHLWSRLFQPMWGTGRPREVSNLVTLPGIIPRPSTPPFSSLPSNKSCMPRQMPRKGFPACRHLQTAAREFAVATPAVAHKVYCRGRMLHRSDAWCFDCCF